jgi:hypothetical protein
MMMLRVLMLGRRNDPRTKTYTLGQCFTRANSYGNLYENAVAQIKPRTRAHTSCELLHSKRM